MAKPRTKFEASTHRPLVAALYLKGYTQAAIGEQLEISVATVNRDLKFIQEQWRQSAIADMDAVKQRELEKIDVLEYEAWQAWLRSQADSVSKTVFGDSKGKITNTRNQYGDPRFLAQIERCIELRCKILGINAPEKIEVIDWQHKLEQHGYNASAIYNQLIALIASGTE